MTLTLPDPSFWDRSRHGARLRARRRERERAVAQAHAWLASPDGRDQLYRELEAAGINPADYERRQEERRRRLLGGRSAT